MFLLSVICEKYGIKTYFKGNRTLKQLLVQPKDKDPKEKKSGLIYHYQCPATNGGDEYIGEHKDPGAAVQRTPEGALPNPGTQATNRTSDYNA